MSDWTLRDGVTVPGQTWVVMSCVGPTARQKAECVAVTFRGAFRSEEEAHAHAKKLHQRENRFDWYVAAANEWLVVPPDPDAVNSTEYSDPRLNELMKTEFEARERGQRDFTDRKNKLMAGDVTDQEAQRAWATGSQHPSENPMG